MIQHRIPARNVIVGDILVATGRRRDINRRVNEIRQPSDQLGVCGPRGGRYALTAAGVESMIVLVTAGGNPVVHKDATVIVLREENE